jgi:hypothetical protein
VGDRGVGGVRAHFERPVGGAAEREKERGRRGPAVGVPRGTGAVVGPGRKQRGGELTGGPWHIVGRRCR